MKKHGEVVKKQIVDQYNSGRSVNDILKEYNISKSTLYNWIKLYSNIKKSRNAKSENITFIEYCKLKKNHAYISEVNKVLKEYFKEIVTSQEDKLSFIHRNRINYSLHALCDALSVRRSTYYHYKKSNSKEKSKNDDDKFKILILEIFKKSQERFGSMKIKAKMNEKGVTISQRRVQRLMKEMNLKCNQKKVKDSGKYKDLQDYSKNKLNREFNQIEPNIVWVSDITYYKLNGIDCYICIVMDLFSRKVLSHEVSMNMNSTIVSVVFLEAFLRRGSPINLMFHSDRGGQYVSNTFVRRLFENKVTQSFSKPGCPYDNAVMESFFRTLKKELLNIEEFNSISELTIAVNDYIFFYNDYRPHGSLNQKTPNQVESLFYEK